jgi:hypothetical protein
MIVKDSGFSRLISTLTVQPSPAGHGRGLPAMQI